MSNAEVKSKRASRQTFPESKLTIMSLKTSSNAVSVEAGKKSIR